MTQKDHVLFAKGKLQDLLNALHHLEVTALSAPEAQYLATLVRRDIALIRNPDARQGPEALVVKLVRISE